MVCDRADLESPPSDSGDLEHAIDSGRPISAMFFRVLGVLAVIVIAVLVADLYLIALRQDFIDHSPLQ